MLFALKVTSENVGSIAVWNGGMAPDEEVIDQDYYFITGTSNDFTNDILSGETFHEEYKFVGQELKGEFSQVEKV